MFAGVKLTFIQFSIGMKSRCLINVSIYELMKKNSGESISYTGHLYLDMNLLA